jgi:hypothetical protein
VLPVVRLVKGILRTLPADLRPRTGQPWDSTRARRSLTRQLFNTPFAADLTCTSAQASVSDRRSNISASFDAMGAVELDGITYTVDVSLYTHKDLPPALVAQMTRGTRVRVRAVIRSVTISTTGNGVDVKNITFYVSLANPTISILDAAPTPANKVR